MAASGLMRGKTSMMQTKTAGVRLARLATRRSRSRPTKGLCPTLMAILAGVICCGCSAYTSVNTQSLGPNVLSLSPTSIDLGNVNVGSSSLQNVTVTNTGNSNVTISGVSTSGAGFSASGVGANTVLTPSQSATLTVSFAPTSVGSASGSVSVASDASNSPAIVSVSGAGVSSTSTLPTCGKLNDTNVYLPPNYDTFTPPAKGGSYSDPVFGCKITRITDAVSMGWVSANHFYNTVTPFNANDTYLYLFNGFSGGPPMITDLTGNTIVPSSNMPGSNSAIMVWDTTNPNVFYYTSGNQFIKGTITGTSPNATVTPTVLATLPYTSVIPADEDISDDGLHIWLADCFQDCTGNVFLVTLNAGNGAATSASLGTVMSNINHHKLQIVPNNGVSVEGSAARTIYNTSGSVYSVPGNGNGNHTDWGLDGSGKMVAGAVWFDGTSQNGCPSNWGFGLLDLGSNTVGRCLTDGIDTNTVGSASHVSARDMRSQHWIVFSADDSSSSCPSSSFYCYNNPTSLSGWTAFSGEIVIWDGLGNTVRLAHHRSRTNENYWAQSRASVSRSGKYIVFDSNFNQSSTAGGANYTDVFVIGPLY